MRASKADGVSLPRRIPGSPTFDQGCDIRFTRDGFTYRALDSRVSLRVYSMMRGRFSQHEHIEGNAVLASVELRAQNFDPMRGERSGDISAQTVSIVRAYG